MVIIISRESDEPVYEQVARQIRDRVASGELLPGTPLPTVRTLASDLGVNLNTVARAYRLLEEEGFVRIQDRSGAQVIAPTRKPSGERERLRMDLRKQLVRMRQAGLSPDELRRVAEREIASLAETPER